MYLIEIDEKTKLVKDSPSNSGWKAISDLSALKDLKELTVVALTCDYLSPLRHYKEDDRFFRALEEVYGDRDALSKNLKRIKAAIKKYMDLQFNSDLEFISINQDIKHRLTDELRKANQDRDEIKIQELVTLINKNKATMNKFMEDFDKETINNNAVTENGYELSRIERDIKSRKNSKFVNNAENIKNPNKLKLQENG